VDTARHGLSDDARVILESMEPERRYGLQDLLALVSGASVGQLREVMHELWIARQVERVGYTGWRRARSEPAHRREAVAHETQPVTADALFDHATFADFFK
jgi:hypothetical protein